MAKAEQLKIEEGSVISEIRVRANRSSSRTRPGFAGKEVEREMLNTIIHCRVRETFELLKTADRAGEHPAITRRGNDAHRRMQHAQRDQSSRRGNLRLAGASHPRADRFRADLGV